MFQSSNCPRSDKFKTTHGKTGVYFGEDKLKIGNYWIAHMASADGSRGVLVED